MNSSPRKYTYAIPGHSKLTVQLRPLESRMQAIMRDLSDRFGWTVTVMLAADAPKQYMAGFRAKHSKSSDYVPVYVHWPHCVEQ